MLKKLCSRAFTLLELVGVLVIIGVLSGLGAVTYTQLIAKSSGEVEIARGVDVARETYVNLAAAGVTDFEATNPGNGYSYRQSIMAAVHAETDDISMEIPVGSATDVGAYDSFFSEGAPAAPSAPSEPGSGTSTTPSNSQMTLSWDAATGEVSHYQISWTPGAGMASVPAPTTTYVVTGLTNGIEYTFSISAVGMNGEGDPLVVSGIPVAAPGTPGTPTATISSSVVTDVDVTWDAPVDDGGSVIIGYNVEVTSDGVVGATFATGSASPSTVYTGVLGSTYSFRVQSVNAFDTSAAFSTPSNSLFVVTDPDTPGAPTAVAGIGEADLTWSAPSSDGGSPITDYTIEVSANSGVSWTTVSDGASTATSATVTGLVNGSTYVFRIAASNAYGTSSFSTQSTDTFIAGPPGVPTGLGASPGNGQVGLAWNAPVDTGGSPITDYVIEYSTDNASWLVFADGTSTATSTTKTGLSNGTLYYFRASAVNAAGTSPAGSTTSATPVLPFAASGGTTSTYGGYRSHTFSQGTSAFSFTGAPAGFTVDVLIVAGGGAGGCGLKLCVDNDLSGPGGGAGEMTVLSGYSPGAVSGAYTTSVVVGGGGAAQQNMQYYYGPPSSGEDSSAFGITAAGGGAAGYGDINMAINSGGTSYRGVAGGSGGGSTAFFDSWGYFGYAGSMTSYGGASTATQGLGNAGGMAFYSPGDKRESSGGGACGAGTYIASSGGAWVAGGLPCSNDFQTGSNQFYAEGGRACAKVGSAYPAVGCMGPTITYPGSGGQGGRSWNPYSSAPAEAGQPGTVIIRYVIP